MSNIKTKFRLSLDFEDMNTGKTATASVSLDETEYEQVNEDYERLLNYYQQGRSEELKNFFKVEDPRTQFVRGNLRLEKVTIELLKG